VTRTLEADLLVIGGGATGGGIAWDASLRGLRVVLAEMGDLATGTSGRYHGLLHSGGRYAVRDPESAKECIDENQVLRKIVPHALEDTGGYFVLCPDDDEAYVDTWLQACRAAGIETHQIPVARARTRERALNSKMKVVYEVPDGTCDSWDLLHALQAGAEQAGATFLTYHRADDFHIRDGKLTGVRLTDVRTGEAVEVSCQAAINATGPWAKALAARAGCHFNMKLSRGAMIAFNIRWVNTVINRLRKPGDGDIFVPVGTVSVAGTTSVKTDDPGDSRVEHWEVERILSETEPMTPGISHARILRAWGGVRPLYDAGSAEGREAARTFTLLDHAHEGVLGFYSIVGGKLTTFRQMAERTVDTVCRQLGNTAVCTTAVTTLPQPHGHSSAPGTRAYHQLAGRLSALEHGQTPGALICECEIVTDHQIQEAVKSGAVHNLHDLRRDLRVGMGPCQAGFCGYRAAAIRHSIVNDTPANTLELLREYIERRFGGMRPLLWGHNLRQIALNEHIYGRILGLMPAPRGSTHIPQKRSAASGVSAKGDRPRVLIVGAGLSGLMAALSAQAAGAHVEVIAQGQGAFTLHPGWIETGDVDALAKDIGHPYVHAAEALPEALALLAEVIELQETGGAVLTGLGTWRAAAYGAGIVTAPVEPGSRIVSVGIRGWRDFYAALIADQLKAQSYEAQAVEIDLPKLGGDFDNWTIDIARYLDTAEGQRNLIEQVRPLCGTAAMVAFPAILGFDAKTAVNIRSALGRPLIEIPTLTPSVPGLRLYYALRARLLKGGARLTLGPRITHLEIKDGHIESAIAESSSLRPRSVRADSVILATGGLYGGGLESDFRGRVIETTAGLPVAHVPSIAEWFAQPFTGGAAQPIHLAGIETDEHMRPLGEDGKPFAANLFACGRLLAGSSPVAQGCTEGVDLATGVLAGRNAVQQAVRRIQEALR
jgi:glycerol-3-phosphate dehydrogenase